jgi:hypothetical protein
VSEPTQGPSAELPPLELEQLRDAWQRGVVDAVRERSIPIATLLSEAHPVSLDGDTLTLEFAPGSDFHRARVEEPKSLQVLRDALYEVTGRRLAVATVVGESVDEPAAVGDDEPLSEEDVISLLKDTFDAREVEGA